MKLYCFRLCACISLVIFSSSCATSTNVDQPSILENIRNATGPSPRTGLIAATASHFLPVMTGQKRDESENDRSTVKVPGDTESESEEEPSKKFRGRKAKRTKSSSHTYGSDTKGSSGSSSTSYSSGSPKDKLLTSTKSNSETSRTKITSDAASRTIRDKNQAGSIAKQKSRGSNALVHSKADSGIDIESEEEGASHHKSKVQLKFPTQRRPHDDFKAHSPAFSNSPSYPSNDDNEKSGEGRATDTGGSGNGNSKNGYSYGYNRSPSGVSTGSNIASTHGRDYPTHNVDVAYHKNDWDSRGRNEIRRTYENSRHNDDFGTSAVESQEHDNFVHDHDGKVGFQNSKFGASRGDTAGVLKSGNMRSPGRGSNRYVLMDYDNKRDLESRSGNRREHYHRFRENSHDYRGTENNLGSLGRESNLDTRTPHEYSSVPYRGPKGEHLLNNGKKSREIQSNNAQAQGLGFGYGEGRGTKAVGIGLGIATSGPTPVPAIENDKRRDKDYTMEQENANLQDNANNNPYWREQDYENEMGRHNDIESRKYPDDRRMPPSDTAGQNIPATVRSSLETRPYDGRRQAAGFGYGESRGGKAVGIGIGVGSLGTTPAPTFDYARINQKRNNGYQYQESTKDREFTGKLDPRGDLENGSTPSRSSTQYLLPEIAKTKTQDNPNDEHQQAVGIGYGESNGNQAVGVGLGVANAKKTSVPVAQPAPTEDKTGYGIGPPQKRGGRVSEGTIVNELSALEIKLE